MSLRLPQQTHSVVWTNKKEIHFFRSFASVGSARSNCVCRVHRWCSVQCQYDYGIRWRRYTYLSSPPPPQLTTIFLFLCCFVVPIFALVVFFSLLISSHSLLVGLVLSWAERRTHIVIGLFSVFISWILFGPFRVDPKRFSNLAKRPNFWFWHFEFYFEFPTWRVCAICAWVRARMCDVVLCTCVRVVDGTGRVACMSSFAFHARNSCDFFLSFFFSFCVLFYFDFGVFFSHRGSVVCELCTVCGE